MSVYYNAEAYCYTPFDEKAVCKILKKCEDLGHSLVDEDYNMLGLAAAVKYVLAGIDDPIYHVIRVKFKDYSFKSLLFFPKKNVLHLALSIDLREYVLNGQNQKECITPSLYLLDIISDFQVQNFFITHDMDGIFEHSIEKNMFYVLTHSTYPKGKNFCARDAFYIIRQIRNIGCSFITESGTEIDQDTLIEEIAAMLLSSKNSASAENALIIKTTNGSLIKATFYNYAFQFLPLHPWTMKQTEERTSIDVAYYTKILLVMAEPFGIIELATHCNDAFYE